MYLTEITSEGDSDSQFEKVLVHPGRKGMIVELSSWQKQCHGGPEIREWDMSQMSRQTSKTHTMTYLCQLCPKC